MVSSVLEQGQNCLILAREVLDLERVLLTAAGAASFARSPGQMPYSFQEPGAERGSLLKLQGLSYNDLNHLFRRNINGTPHKTPDILRMFLLEDLSPHFKNSNKKHQYSNCRV